MKLFNKFNRINLIATVTVFVLSSVAFYFLLRFVLIDQIDDSLAIEQEEIETYIKKYDKLPETMQLKDQSIQFGPWPTAIKSVTFSQRSFYDDNEKEKVFYRQLEFGVQANGHWYKATVSKSLEDTDNITQTIILITAITILLVLLIGLIINRIVLKQLWKPFYQSLDIMRGFNLSAGSPPAFAATTIEEFTFMNQTLGSAVGKAQKDYTLLKEFTENASHELQTPLAVIRSKLDILIQDEELSERQGKTVQAINDALGKLSKMNRALLLLAKIENGQFTNKYPVNLKEKIKEKLFQLNSLHEQKHLLVSASLENITISIDPALADILLGNLINNAFRHTPKEGKITVTLNHEKLSVCNTGSTTLGISDNLFRRFYKTNAASAGNGLGLAIIKQISEVCGYQTIYRFENQMHEFAILFP